MMDTIWLFVKTQPLPLSFTMASLSILADFIGGSSYLATPPMLIIT